MLFCNSSADLLELNGSCMGIGQLQILIRKHNVKILSNNEKI